MNVYLHRNTRISGHNFGSHQLVAERFFAPVCHNGFFSEDSRQTIVVCDDVPMFHEDSFDGWHSRIVCSDHDRRACVTGVCTSGEGA